MASPYPLECYWEAEAPTPAACARAICEELSPSSAAITLVGPDGEEVTGAPAEIADRLRAQADSAVMGFLIQLPEDAQLFLDGRDRRSVRFSMTGPDLLHPYDAGQRATATAIVRAVLVAIVARAGAVAAWCGSVREEFIASDMDAFAERMRARHAGERLPFSALAGGVWMAAWRAEVASDLACAERDRNACLQVVNDCPLR